MPFELLTVDEMYEADRRTVEAGTPGLELMENAGAASAEAIAARWPKRPVCVLCGPGNNGGDGFVIARLLNAKGWPVRLFLLGERDKLKGDGAAMAARWKGKVAPLADADPADSDLVVDAVFGAGLTRPVEGRVAKLFNDITRKGLPVAAVDLPSGVSGVSGHVLGTALRADLTVTFACKKWGHVLAPGRFLCGEIHVADIGIPDAVIDEIAPKAFENTPAMWAEKFPRLDPLGHKYSRGHALVVSGGVAATGAARMAAMGALRAGAGLVTVASPPDALLVNAAHLTAVMVRPFDGARGLQALLEDTRKNAVAIGPGCGVGEATRELVRAVAASHRAAVLDADALTSFEENPKELFTNDRKNAVFTPHEGEFARLFPQLIDKDEAKIVRAREAANESGAVILFKGPDTVIAAPDGRAAVVTNAPADLATAGSGDVLTGIICGLMAQHMPAFEAACAGAWLHGECGSRLGRGLIAEDLPDKLPEILQNLELTLAS